MNGNASVAGAQGTGSRAQGDADKGVGADGRRRGLDEVGGDGGS